MISDATIQPNQAKHTLTYSLLMTSAHPHTYKKRHRETQKKEKMLTNKEREKEEDQGSQRVKSWKKNREGN